MALINLTIPLWLRDALHALANAIDRNTGAQDRHADEVRAHRIATSDLCGSVDEHAHALDRNTAAIEANQQPADPFNFTIGPARNK